MRKLPLNRAKVDKNFQGGQALLIVLLTMAVILTVVLSVVSRSVTDVTVTTYEEDALRAFSAAEAGIEEKLLNPSLGSFGPVLLGDPSYKYEGEVTNPSEVDKQFKYQKDLTAGEIATFWLVSHNSTGQLTCSGGVPCFRANIMNVCWGNPTSVVTPAVEILFFYDTTRLSVDSSNNYASVRVKRFAHSPTGAGGFQNPAGLNAGCNFTNGDSFKYRSQINVNNDIDAICDDSPLGCPLMVKVRMYYATSAEPPRAGIWTRGPASSLPAQGLNISSTGTAGESSRRVNVFQGYSESPTFFDAAVFSLKDLVK